MSTPLHPADRDDFGTDAVAPLRPATADLSWLVSRGYPRPASLRLVGDRHGLNRRQRKAVSRCAAGDDEVRGREERRLEPGAIRGRRLQVDGFNVLLTVLAALVGAPILVGRDGVYRDVAALSRQARHPDATERAVDATGRRLAELAPSEVRWFLDRPVKGSGELRGLLERCAAKAGWPWTAELVDDPDPLLADAEIPVATADSAILDAGGPWLDLARHVVDGIDAEEGGVWWVDLSA